MYPCAHTNERQAKKVLLHVSQKKLWWKRKICAELFGKHWLYESTLNLAGKLPSFRLKNSLNHKEFCFASGELKFWSLKGFFNIYYRTTKVSASKSKFQLGWLCKKLLASLWNFCTKVKCRLVESSRASASEKCTALLALTEQEEEGEMLVERVKNFLP